MQCSRQNAGSLTVEAKESHNVSTLNEYDREDSESFIEEETVDYRKNFAEWYYEKGDLEEASKLYSSLVFQCMRTTGYAKLIFQMRFHMAQISWLLGYHKESEKMFRTLNEAVEIMEEQDICDMAKWLALAQWKQGKYQEAESTIVHCFTENSETRRNLPALLSTRALILASMGSFRKALQLSFKAIDGGRYPIDQDGSNVVYILNHARVLSEIGQYDEAAESNNEALVNMQKLWGPRHFATLDAASLRVWLLVVNNKTVRPSEEVQQTLRQLRERLGEEHPSTLQTVQTLVLAYKNDGRYSDAEETARYLLRKCDENRELGPGHPQTLRSKTMLAEVLLALGKWKEAELCQREVVAEKGVTYFHRITLANILREQGKWDEALDLAIRVLIEQLNRFRSDQEVDHQQEPDQPKELSGEEITNYELRHILRSSKYVTHTLRNLPSELYDPLATHDSVRVYPILVQTMQCVALCEQKRDDANLTFVENILNKIYDICFRKIGEMHPFTIGLKYDLAVNYRLRGSFDEALQAVNHVVEQRQRILGSDHPDYLLGRHERAVILFRLGKWQEALTEQESTLKAQEFLLGRKHPTTILSRYTLAGLYHSLNQLEKGDVLLEAVIADQRRIYNQEAGESGDHPIVLRSRARHALICLDRAMVEQDEARFASAEREQQIIVERRREYLGADHHITQSSYNDLAQIKQARGERKEAEKIYTMLLTGLDARDKRDIDVNGRPNMLQFQIQSNLATCYYEMERFEDAEKLQTELLNEIEMSRVGRRENDERFVASAFNLALTCKALNDFGRACSFLKKAVRESERLVGVKHPQTQELKATLAKWTQTRGYQESVDPEQIHDEADRDRFI
ncbi:hypothetical protein N0V83_004158 [Neocucurbitaria cava]|uniref:TPR-like protein n=1 Tax=Neocucurbitaria cava TaxID=798079 RepID=A0A9W9CNU8_9PLEO|nr:hypothetical protein N0V83_004158 [Neocucurbitaria cava]